ncbi:MAG: hypothetical protein KF716_00285 [Anaerolineae bacterium]|nr:hypothetical protein [Anaerolineae bacterium]
MHSQSVVSRRTSLFLTLALLVALVSYYLPWLNNAAAGLSANAFDLAEWISLSPLVRGANPPMLAPFLLRLSLSLLALLFALNISYTSGWLRWLSAGLCLLLIITLFPPIEFIRAPGGMDDPNYRQLFGLFLFTLLMAGAVLIVPRLRLWRKPLSGLFALLLMVSSLWGTALAFSILASDPIRLTTPLGLGLVGLIIALIAHQIVSWRIPNV